MALATVTTRFLGFFGVTPTESIQAALYALGRIKDNRARQQATEAVAMVSRHYKTSVRKAMEPPEEGEQADSPDRLRRRIADALMDGDDDVLLAIAVANDRDGSLQKMAEEG